MLKEVVDFLLTRSKFFYPDMFRHMVAFSGGRECLISYSSNVMCYVRPHATTTGHTGQVTVRTRP
jgi:hypothetical protein